MGKDDERINEMLIANAERFERMCWEGAEALKALANKDINIIVDKKGAVDMKNAWNNWRAKGVGDGIGGEARTAVRMILNMHDSGMEASSISIIAEKPESEARSIITTKGQCAIAHA